MFLQRSAVAVARRAAMAPVLRRSLATTAVRRESCAPKFEKLGGKISQGEKGCYDSQLDDAASLLLNW